MNIRAKVYMGRDGYAGVSRIGRASFIEKHSWPKKKEPKCVGRGVGGGGGVSVSRVLRNGGVVGGAAVRVEEKRSSAVGAAKRAGRIVMVNKAIGEAIIEVKTEEAVKAAVESDEARKSVLSMEKAKADAKEAKEEKASLRAAEAESIPPKDEHGNETKPGVEMTETEERLAEYLGAAEEAVLKVEAAEEKSSEEEAKVIGVALPEHHAVGDEVAEPAVQKRKGRKRKGRKAAAEVEESATVAMRTEVAETERAAIQAEVEAASDAAASVL